MSSDHYKLSEVFGISRHVPLNYTTRPNVDNALVDLLTREKHIVLYGSSKQGTTCLRKYNRRQARESGSSPRRLRLPGPVSVRVQSAHSPQEVEHSPKRLRSDGQSQSGERPVQTGFCVAMRNDG